MRLNGRSRMATEDQRMKPRFSLAMLFLEITLIGAVIGLTREGIRSWDKPIAPACFVSALLMMGAAYAVLRVMLGASEPPDFPPAVP